jgi:hypothetical protein
MAVGEMRSIETPNREANQITEARESKEAFAQALARGMSASAAYVEAGYKASTTDALG